MYPAVGLDVLSLDPADLSAPVLLWETLAAGTVGVAVIDGTTEEWDADRSLQQSFAMRQSSPSPSCAAFARPQRKHATSSLRTTIISRPCSTGSRLRPVPTLVAAQLLRNPSAAAESFAYSMLLASSSFRDWRSEHELGVPETGHDADRIAVEERRDVTILRLTRPAKHNAYDARMREQLCDALDAVRAAGAKRLVLLGDGRSFCAGGDLDEFGLNTDPVSSHTVRTGRSVARRLRRTADRLVVGVHGHCIGAGIELASFARLVVAAKDTSFACPSSASASTSAAGGAVSVPARIGRHRTLELLLAPDPIDADDRTRVGPRRRARRRRRARVALRRSSPERSHEPRR